MSRVFDRRHIETAAEYADYSVDEIEEAVWDVHDAVRSNLIEHYEKCWLQRGENYILNDSRKEVFFALSRFQVNEQLNDVGVNMEPGLLIAALNAYTIFYQEQLGRTIAFSRQIGYKYSDPQFFPVYIKKSEEWLNGVYHMFQMFKRYLYRHDMSAAEALDMWALDYMSTDAREWAKCRDVSDEAVRKNARQGRNQLFDEELGATHKTNQFLEVSIEEINEKEFVEGVYDKENEQFYAPRLLKILDNEE